jgi:SsrA-binding protein
MSSRIVNRKARFEYQILETVEAGVALEGREVKSLRLGRGSLSEAFVMIRDGEAYLHNANIPGYGFSDLRDYEPTRARKLLLHRSELESLAQKVKGANLALVPVEILLKRGKFKVLVGLARGKQQHEKRSVIRQRRQRDLEREVKRDMKLRLR